MSVTLTDRSTLLLVLVVALAALGLAGEVALEVRSTEEPVYLVIHVVDGDTIVLENSESVRYLGVDTPETHHPVRGLECYGPEATERNMELVEGKLIRLEKDQTDRDRYGRLLRYVYVDGVFVNAKLVEEGYAYSSYYPPDTKYYEQLLALELEAEQEGRGLWSACPR